MRALELKVPPVAVTLLSAGLMWAIAVAFPGANVPVAGHWVIAGAIAFIGGAIAIAGVFAFRRHETTVNPTKPHSASAVVSDGIYGFTRNPMYLGLAIFLAGCAVFLQNWVALLVLPAFVAYMNRYQIRPEERALLELFGAAYGEYTSKVRRWL
jgi:protein-S-isoprenylcysteine O-methyltransferase Ste14